MIYKRNLILFFIAALIIAGSYLASKQRVRSLRAPASQSEIEDTQNRNVKTKIEMIQNIEFIDMPELVELTIKSKGSNFCNDWTSLSVSIQPDGVAISGTPPELKVEGTCKDNQLKVTFTKDLSQWADQAAAQEFAKLNVYNYFISLIQISGNSGVMVISPNEIQSVLNKSFEFSN